MEIKTSMTTCPNGHHYDASKHASCPYCSSAPQVGGFAPTEPLTGGAPVAPGAFPQTAPPVPGMGGGRVGGFAPTEPPTGAAGRPGGFAPTVPPSDSRIGRGPVAGRAGGNFQETKIGGSPKAVGDVTEPVVGWLVSVEGPSRGVDYKIHTGYNYIGREVGDIKIEGDQQISRQNHAMLAYVKKEHKFYVGPVAGLNIIEVNGAAVLQSAVEIHNYDIISIGATKLIFVGLCGEEFDWEKRLSND